MTTNPNPTYGAARIGTGTKLHRAVKYGDSNFVQMLCGCPGTSNNHARVSSFFPELLGTCARSRTMPIPPTTCGLCGARKPADRSCDCFDNHCQ